MKDLDSILQEKCPTIMAPKFKKLPEIVGPGNYRFIMAQDGLYIDVYAGWGRFRERIWKSERSLPYGEILRTNELFGGKFPENIIKDAVVQSVVSARRNEEWAGWLTWNETDGYHLFSPDVIKAGSDRVSYHWPSLPDKTFLVLDLHSHPMDYKHFSTKDDYDDQGGVRYSGVISMKVEKEKILITVNSRLCLEGFFFEGPSSCYEFDLGSES